MLNSMKLLILCVATTAICTVVDNTFFAHIEGGTFLFCISFLGFFGIIISFAVVLIEIHHNATKNEGEE